MKPCVKIGTAMLVLCIAIAGCSRKLVVMSLDDAIVTVAERTREAHCRGASLSKDVSAEFYVETAQKISAGAPTGAIPITLAGEAAAKESTKVTVLLDTTKMRCDQKISEKFPPTIYDFSPSEKSIKEIR
jgi:hypothetical protein